MLLVRTAKKLDDIVKEIRNNIQRRAGLQQLQAQQPRLAVKIDVLEDKKTRESRETLHQTEDWEISRLTGSMTRCV